VPFVGLTVGLDDGRTACAESIESFVRAVDAFSEYHLLDASRCHGWTRLDVAVHVLAGWQEMLGGLVSVRDSDPTVDAATLLVGLRNRVRNGRPGANADVPAPTQRSVRAAVLGDCTDA
jgi:hypothetical protein